MDRERKVEMMNFAIAAVVALVFLVLLTDGYNKGVQIRELEARTRKLENLFWEAMGELDRLDKELKAHIYENKI